MEKKEKYHLTETCPAYFLKMLTKRENMSTLHVLSVKLFSGCFLSIVCAYIYNDCLCTMDPNIKCMSYVGHNLKSMKGCKGSYDWV